MTSAPPQMARQALALGVLGLALDVALFFLLPIHDLPTKVAILGALAFGSIVALVVAIRGRRLLTR